MATGMSQGREVCEAPIGVRVVLLRFSAYPYPFCMLFIPRKFLLIFLDCLIDR